VSMEIFLRASTIAMPNSVVSRAVAGEWIFRSMIHRRGPIPRLPRSRNISSPTSRLSGEIDDSSVSN
jgi:hypothetical protein